MDEYIKRKDVKKAIRCKGENLIFHKGKLFIPFSVVRSAIENAPAADVAPKCIQFIDNKHQEYVFPQEEQKDE